MGDMLKTQMISGCFRNTMPKDMLAVGVGGISLSSVDVRDVSPKNLRKYECKILHSGAVGVEK